MLLKRRGEGLHDISINRYWHEFNIWTEREGNGREGVVPRAHSKSINVTQAPLSPLRSTACPVLIWLLIRFIDYVQNPQSSFL